MTILIEKASDDVPGHWDDNGNWIPHEDDLIEVEVEIDGKKTTRPLLRSEMNPWCVALLNPSAFADRFGNIEPPELDKKFDASHTYFKGYANFNGVQFTRYTDFYGAQFMDEANFEGAHFEGYADFEGTQFKGYANFNDAQFTNSAYFKGAQFAGSVDFSDAQFKSRAYFNGAQFEDSVDFKGVQFERSVDFKGAQFTSDAFFNGAQFGGTASFMGTQFTSYAFFNGAHFKSRADFEGAQFKRGAYFRGAQFEGIAKFEGARFTSHALFKGATFADYADFDDATFKQFANFVGATFKGSTNFKEARFMQSPPNLHHVSELPSDTRFSRYFSSSYWPEPSIAHKSLYENLRKLSIHASLVDEERFFDVQILRCKEAEDKGNWRTWLSHRVSQAYGELANYGTSWEWPLIFLIGTPFIFAFLILVSDPNITCDWKAIEISFANAYGFLGIKSVIFRDFYKDLEPLTKVILAGQSIWSLVLLFLFGLGVRSRFRVK